MQTQEVTLSSEIEKFDARERFFLTNSLANSFSRSVAAAIKNGESLDEIAKSAAVKSRGKNNLRKNLAVPAIFLIECLYETIRCLNENENKNIMHAFSEAAAGLECVRIARRMYQLALVLGFDPATEEAPNFIKEFLSLECGA